MNIHKGVLINAIPLKNKLKLKQLKHSSRWLLTFPYQAFERPKQFVGNATGILRDGEISIHLHGLEVRSIRAVTPTSDSNIIALVNVRIPFASRRRQGLDESKVTIIKSIILTRDVMSQNALVIFSGLHDYIVLQLGFQVDA